MSEVEPDDAGDWRRSDVVVVAGADCQQAAPTPGERQGEAGGGRDEQPGRSASHGVLRPQDAQAAQTAEETVGVLHGTNHKILGALGE